MDTARGRLEDNHGQDEDRTASKSSAVNQCDTVRD